MAKQTITKLVDDLDGGVAHETIIFGLDGHRYEIDLSSKNAKKLRSELAAYVAHGSRVTNRGTDGRGARGRGRSTGSGTDVNRSIREWAQANGLDIAPRGRIRQEILDQYAQANGR